MQPFARWQLLQSEAPTGNCTATHLKLLSLATREWHWLELMNTCSTRCAAISTLLQCYCSCCKLQQQHTQQQHFLAALSMMTIQRWKQTLQNLQAVHCAVCQLNCTIQYGCKSNKACWCLRDRCSPVLLAPELPWHVPAHREAQSDTELMHFWHFLAFISKHFAHAPNSYNHQSINLQAEGRNNAASFIAKLYST